VGVEGKNMSVLRESLPERKFWAKVFPWLSALILAAGVIALIIKLVPGTSGTQDASSTKNPTRVAPTPKTVKLSNAARGVAGRFILTAVRRQHLDEAWKISGPEIRQDLTYKEWLTGNIPVIPYNAPISITPMKIDYSFKNQALVEVALVPVKTAKKAKTELYFLELRRIGKGTHAHWVVWSWVPRLAAPIRANPAGG
jgi:hypothetical protein